jgi:hypothetical protein
MNGELIFRLKDEREFAERDHSENGECLRKVLDDAISALSQLAAGSAEPVAEVVSKFGDPEAFGERELKVLIDIQKLPYGTKFYTHPAPLPVQAEPYAYETRAVSGLGKACITMAADFQKGDIEAHVAEGFTVTPLYLQPAFPANWLPTAEAINALPAPVRKHMIELGSRCDPAGDVAKIALLTRLNEELQAALQAALVPDGMVAVPRDALHHLLSYPVRDGHVTKLRCAHKYFNELKAALATEQPDHVEDARQLPPMNDALLAILGRPNFGCYHIAQALRAKGVEIARKSEREQAAVIHYLLNLYLKHGDAWADVAEAALATTGPGSKREGAK